MQSEVGTDRRPDVLSLIDGERDERISGAMGPTTPRGGRSVRHRQQAGGSSDVATTPGGTDDHPFPVQQHSMEVLQR